jgi:uncharacterized cofD-like protein
MKSIVTIGGGTGQFTLLTGLKKYPVELTAIVSMTDEGGSTGVLRDELGVLPPGDVRQCLVAISEADVIVRELFNYRFDAGGLKGHNFGNIFLSALEKITGNFDEAVRVASKVLATRGTVIPVTTQNVRLICTAGETCLVGENAITFGVIPKGATFRLEPEAYATPKAIEALERADVIVIGPGLLYASVITNFLVQGIPEAIGRSKAKVVYNCNLMNRAGQTDGFTVHDYLREIEKYLGEGRVDYVIYNDRIPEKELLDRYALEGEMLVPSVEASEKKGRHYIAADLISRKIPVVKAGDAIKRTLIRHDADLLASLIMKHCLGKL